MAECRSHIPVEKFGDINITVIVDLGVNYPGLELVTANAVNELISCKGSGRCSVALQLLGVNEVPIIVDHVEPRHFMYQGRPCLWERALQSAAPGLRHVVVLAIHDNHSQGPLMPLPKFPGFFPVVLSCEVHLDKVKLYTQVPESHILLSERENMAASWRVVRSHIEDLRAVANFKDKRSYSKLSFSSSEKDAAFSFKSDAEYFRKVGMSDVVIVGHQHSQLKKHNR